MEILKSDADAGISEIANFYAGKTVLITGATGFMGKVLVEKLLRSCADLEAIYLLIRTKKGVEPTVRKEQYFKCVVSTKKNYLRFTDHMTLFSLLVFVPHTFPSDLAKVFSSLF